MKKDIKYILNKVLNKGVLPEACEIISKLEQKYIDELIHYYITDNHNVFCLHIDYCKNILVKKGLMIQNENDSFGNIDFD